MVQFQNWSNEAAEKMKTAMQRKNCAVQWVQLVVDHEGAMAIVHFQHPLILGHTKNATGVIMKCLPAEQQRIAETSLRPLDCQQIVKTLAICIGFRTMVHKSVQIQTQPKVLRTA